MDYKVNFTWYDHMHNALVENADVDVLDVPHQAGATKKIMDAMRKKFDQGDHEGSIRINECNKISSPDDILALEDGVTPVLEKKKRKKAKPFFTDGDQHLFNFTTNDFMNTKEFREKALDRK